MPTKIRPAAAPTAATLTTISVPTKTATVLKLLARAKGATVAEIAELTGWQPHSVRSYLTGLRKKGNATVRDKRKDGETVYRIAGRAGPAGDAASAPIAEPVVADPTAGAEVGNDTSDSTSTTPSPNATA